MNNIDFYEVLDKRDRFMGAYSTKFNSEINVGLGALGMALINAKQSNGEIFSVTYNGERELVWPK